jgi:hypothetical protein
MLDRDCLVPAVVTFVETVAKGANTGAIAAPGWY